MWDQWLLELKQVGVVQLDRSAPVTPPVQSIHRIPRAQSFDETGAGCNLAIVVSMSVLSGILSCKRDEVSVTSLPEAFLPAIMVVGLILMPRFADRP